MSPSSSKTNRGLETLIKKSEWPDRSEIQGNDLDVLKSPTMEKAFQRILELHHPRHRIAVFGLCSATRPYSKSRSWAKRIEKWEGDADFIITSNGGVIPIEFENCYPYLTYDAHGEKKYDKPYILKLAARLELFLRKFPYRFVLFHYRHNLRNVAAAKHVGNKLKQEGVIEDFAILPKEHHYEQARRENFIMQGFKMYPELYPCMLTPVDLKLQEFKTRLKVI